MIDRLYVARGDKTFGPFSAIQLRGLAATGRLHLTDSVWRHGAMENSVFAATVKNLFPSPQAPAHDTGAGAPEAIEPTPSAPGAALVASSASSLAPTDELGAVTVVSPAVAASTDSAPQDSAAVLGAADTNPSSNTVPKEKAPRPPPEPVRKRRAVAVLGATILSQDGVTVHYRKKCTQCGFEDRCRSSMPIGNGMTRIHFFCSQCRKGRDVQLMGIMQ